MAAEPGFEPGLEDPKSPVLPLHNSALSGAEGRARTDMRVAPQQFLRLPRLPIPPLRREMSGRRDSNSRPSPWQGDALPLSHFRLLNLVPRPRIELGTRGFSVRCSTD